MRTRFTWIVAISSLVAIAFSMACSSKYSASNNGLIVVPSYGSLVMQSFSLNLGNGSVSQINNVNGPPTPGVPSSVILDPTGSYAYLIVSQNPLTPGSSTGIASFQLASDGKLASGSTSTLNPVSATVSVACSTGALSVSVQAPATPVALTIDAAGKYLFVADSGSSAQGTYTCNGTTTTAPLPVPGAVSVFTVSSGTLSEVSGSPFTLPNQGISQNPSASALGVTSTAYPAQYAACAGHTAPSTEDLFVADSANYFLYNYAVDSSTGALSLVALSNNAPGIATGTLPSGVAVDPCNRFVYVSNNTSLSVSAYTMCSTISIATNCAIADFSLQTVAGSPFAISPGEGPGPLAVDPYGNFVYVVDTGSSQVSAFKINQSSGALTVIGTYAAGLGANSISIRNDETWVFVANYTASTVSQFEITPASGALTPQSPFTPFDTNPTGVAVK